jgi:hypothetical protein
LDESQALVQDKEDVLHLNSELGEPKLHFDHLDENFAMVLSNWAFELICQDALFVM